ncbi:MAG TPA: beta-galactosidase, partial [Chitinophagaceae bacterium]
FKFREVIARHLPPGAVLPPVPVKKKAIAINDIKLTGFGGLFTNLPAPVLSATPLCFEDLNQAYGLVLYRTTLSSLKQGYLKITALRDFAVVYINGKQTGTLDRRLEQDSLLLNDIPEHAMLDILVENNGRINYGPYLTDNRQGITQKVTLGGEELHQWKMYGLPFANLQGIRFDENKPGIHTVQPGCYKGAFTLDEPGDTWLDMRGFGKGFVFLNGHNLGRYWQIGPQQTLYVPAVWLKKGVNEVVVFDLLKHGHTLLTSLSGPVLNQLAAANQ